MDYNCAIEKVKIYLENKDYTNAFNALESAASYPNSNSTEVARLQKEIFSGVTQLQENTEKALKKAEIEQRKAVIAKIKADKIRARNEADRLKAKAIADKLEADRLKAKAIADKLEADRLKAKAIADKIENDRLKTEADKLEAEERAEALRFKKLINAYDTQGTIL